MPKTNGILETALYVTDLERSAEFYRATFGFEAIASGDRLIALRAGDSQVLLLCKKGASRDRKPAPHDGSGQLHLAFATSATELSEWQQWLAATGIAIEDDRTWPRGGRSLYFRDPDGHLLEIASPGVWSVY